jgi:hypothetical protein
MGTSISPSSFSSLGSSGAAEVALELEARSVGLEGIEDEIE